ncbi:uncharacterized protein METZ01_LOCUS297497, partial [marine metagenome]
MTKLKLILFIFIYFFSIAPSSAENQKDPLQTFLKNLESLEVSFVQILMNENGEQLEKTEGVLYLQPPVKFF